MDAEGRFKCQGCEFIGDLEVGKKQSDKIFESEFHDPYLAHAPSKLILPLHNLREIK